MGCCGVLGWRDPSFESDISWGNILCSTRRWSYIFEQHIAQLTAYCLIVLVAPMSEVTCFVADPLCSTPTVGSATPTSDSDDFAPIQIPSTVLSTGHPTFSHGVSTTEAAFRRMVQALYVDSTLVGQKIHQTPLWGISSRADLPQVGSAQWNTQIEKDRSKMTSATWNKALSQCDSIPACRQIWRLVDRYADVPLLHQDEREDRRQNESPDTYMRRTFLSEI
jgi:hypothetical protein